MRHPIKWRIILGGFQINAPFLIFNANICAQVISPHLLDCSSNESVAFAGVVHQDDIESIEFIHRHTFFIQVGLQGSFGSINIVRQANFSRLRSTEDSRRSKAGCGDLATFGDIVDQALAVNGLRKGLADADIIEGRFGVGEAVVIGAGSGGFVIICAQDRIRFNTIHLR